MPELDKTELVPDKVEQAVEQLRDMGRMAGLPDDHIDEIIAKWREARPESLPMVCGRVSKDGRALVCSRSREHPDEPFNRTPHAARTPEGTVVNWLSEPTLPEQLAVEKEHIAAGKGEQCLAVHERPEDTLRCERVKHGPDREHAGYGKDGELTGWA